jgi:hypothetical protein
MTPTWYDSLRKNLNKDPRYKMECTCLDLVEQIVKTHGPARGKYRLYAWLFDRLADKLIWRRGER